MQRRHVGGQVISRRRRGCRRPFCEALRQLNDHTTQGCIVYPKKRTHEPEPLQLAHR